MKNSSIYGPYFVALIVLCCSIHSPSARASDLTVDTATVARAFTVLGTPPAITNGGAGLSGSLTNGLVAYWPLGETNGTTAHDASTNGNNGTLSGGVTLNQNFGLFAGMAFNGSSGQITCPAVIPTGSLAKTISAWIQQTNSATSVPAGLASFGGCGENFRFLLAPGANQYYIDGGCSYVLFNATLTGPHLITATYNGTTMNLFLDGSSVGTTTAGLNTDSANLLIGNDSANNYFAGMIANVGVWNRVLGTNEIVSLYAGGSAPLNTNILYNANGDTNSLFGRTVIKELIRQGDIEMGDFTNKP